jgi:iron(III) transport system ATP-binding protein
MSKIEVNDVVKKFGKVVAVDHFSFSVKEGELLSLLGPSGCGKTTVMRSIAGLEDIDEGEISLSGRVVNSTKKKIFIPPEQRHLGLVFQSYALWPHMTVYKNIAYVLENRLSKQEIKKKVASVLELVRLSGLDNRYPSQLSGGQQQRVALARNLAYEPEVILLDEPLSNLDLKERERTRGELHTLLKRIGITAVYVTHDQEEAFIISDRVILMKDGRLVQEAKPVELYEAPANLFAAEFIGRTNLLKARLVSNDEGERVARIELPDMKTQLVCKYDSKRFSSNLSLVMIRHNEIGMYANKPDFRENVVRGEVVAREYRGAITDHIVSIGDCQLVVTTHKYCNLVKTDERKNVYLYIPPEAIKPIEHG